VTDVELTAHTQYEEFLGTVALDDAVPDLRVEQIFGLPTADRWIVLGFSVGTEHDPDGPAEASFTSATVWAMPASLLDGYSGGLPTYFARADRPFPVTQFTLAPPEAQSVGDDSVSLLLRAFKRINVNAWMKSVHDARLRATDFYVQEELDLD
jgi:hypothetical protein